MGISHRVVIDCQEPLLQIFTNQMHTYQLKFIQYLSPIFARGAKREIRDDDGKLLYNAERQSSFTIIRTFTKEQAERKKSILDEQGVKNVKINKTKLNLSTECPRCLHQGTPTIFETTGTVRAHDRQNGINRDELRLEYSHTKTKPKTCFIGYVNLETPIPEIKLNSKLLTNDLGHRRRVGIYPL